MRGILHEKIQLYIYKPSINKVLSNLNRKPFTLRHRFNWPHKNKLPVLRGVY